MNRTKIIWLRLFRSQTKLKTFLCMLMLVLFYVKTPVFSQTVSRTFCKTGNQWDSDIGKYFFVIKEKDGGGNIVDPWPCGTAYALSVEDDSYIFCKESSLLYTLIPSNTSSKTNSDYDEDKEFKSSITDRVNSVRVIESSGKTGKRLNLQSDDIMKHYPENAMEIFLDGQKQLAFNPENLIYELLVTIQEQYKEITLLNVRLNQIENKIGMTDYYNPSSSSDIENYFKITTNPIEGSLLEIDYCISESINNANIILSTVNGKTLKSIPLNKRGLGFETLDIDLPKGLYFCTLITDGNALETEKFVVQ